MVGVPYIYVYTVQFFPQIVLFLFSTSLFFSKKRVNINVEIEIKFCNKKGKHCAGHRTPVRVQWSLKLYKLYKWYKILSLVLWILAVFVSQNFTEVCTKKNNVYVLDPLNINKHIDGDIFVSRSKLTIPRVPDSF